MDEWNGTKWARGGIERERERTMERGPGKESGCLWVLVIGALLWALLIMGILTAASPAEGGELGSTNTGVLAEVSSVYDGDTIKVNVPGWPALFGSELGIRLRGIDTPEIRGSGCVEEYIRAIAAREFVKSWVAGCGWVVRVSEMSRGKYFRVVGSVSCAVGGRGMGIGSLLVSKGLAVEYDGKGARENWCESDDDG